MPTKWKMEKLLTALLTVVRAGDGIVLVVDAVGEATFWARNPSVLSPAK